MIYRAYYASWNFTFEGFGKTEKQARGALQLALETHTKQYDCDPDWYYPSDIEICKYKLGVPYRDRGEVRLETEAS
jgi:hypothetical protein